MGIVCYGGDQCQQVPRGGSRSVDAGGGGAAAGQEDKLVLGTGVGGLMFLQKRDQFF